MTKKHFKKAATLFLSAVSVFLIIAEVTYWLGVSAFSPSKFVSDAFGASACGNESEFVEFFNVGQGDCTIIKSGDECAVIDFGLPDDSDALYWHLRELGITKIDFALVSHYHEDHLGGLCDVMEKITVKNIMISSEFAEDCDKETLDRFNDVLNQSESEIILPKIGTAVQVGNACIKIIYHNTSADEENNRSVIARMEFNGVAFLFTGDIETKVEKELINSDALISSDVLKVSHHGSSSSTCEDFIKEVNPTVAVFSCGYNNLYNHPSNKTVERLKSAGVTYYRTDIDGNIRVNFGENGFHISTERQASK